MAWSPCKCIYILRSNKNGVPHWQGRVIGSMQKRIIVKIKRDGTELSLREVLDKIKELQDQLPDEDVFFDGDEYAICARPRQASP